MVDEFTDPAFRRCGITRRLAIGMTPRLQECGLGTITRYRVVRKVWFDYVDAEAGAVTSRERDEAELGREFNEPGV
jgi:hypothetical protein